MSREAGILQRIWGRLPTWVKGRGGRIVLTAMLVLPAVAFIAYRSYQNWDQLRASPPTLHPVFLIPTVAGYLLAYLCGLWIWNRLMGRLANFDHFGQNARIYCLSNLPKHIPGPFWYMAGRTYLYNQVGVPPSLTLAGTGLEITLFTVSGLTTYLLVMLVTGPGGMVPLQLGIALLLFLATVLLVQPPVFNRVLAFFLRRLGSTAQVRITYRDLGPLLLAYVVAWGIGGATLYCMARSVYEVPWQQLVDVIGIWAASGTVGLLASTFLFGLGVRELTLSVLLAGLMPQPLAVAVAVLFWFLLTSGDLAAAGLVVLLSRGQIVAGPSFIRRVRKEAEDGTGESGDQEAVQDDPQATQPSG
jgi:hypothetical protein